MYHQNRFSARDAFELAHASRVSDSRAKGFPAASRLMIIERRLKELKPEPKG